MKGIQCTEIERFEFIDHLPEPILAPGHAIVQIRRIGICGTDLHAYKGRQPFFTYPRILGHEIGGTIVAIDDHEAGFAEGDQVSVVPYMHCGHCIACRNGKMNCCTDMSVLGVHMDGGMRERIALPITHLIKTNELSIDQSAMLEPFAIGAHAVRRSGLAEGESVLVIGGGPIGLGVMALAKAKGAKVIGMDVNDERLAFSKRWANADAVVNPLHGAIDQIRAVNDGEMPTIVFDATGNAQSMMDAFQYASHGGTLVFVGLVKADIAFHDPEFHRKELTLMATRNATREDFDTVMEAMNSGSIDVESYITHRASLSGMIGQFDSWLLPETKVIKAIVELQE